MVLVRNLDDGLCNLRNNRLPGIRRRRILVHRLMFFWLSRYVTLFTVLSVFPNIFALEAVPLKWNRARTRKSVLVQDPVRSLLYVNVPRTLTAYSLSSDFNEKSRLTSSHGYTFSGCCWAQNDGYLVLERLTDGFLLNGVATPIIRDLVWTPWSIVWSHVGHVLQRQNLSHMSTVRTKPLSTILANALSDCVH